MIVEKSDQKFRADIFVQSFTLYNARNATELVVAPMNSYNLGEMISKYLDKFINDLDECEVFKLIIDHKFKTFTRPYILKQLLFYSLVYLIPYFLVSFGHLQGVSM